MTKIDDNSNIPTQFNQNQQGVGDSKPESKLDKLATKTSKTIDRQDHQFF